MCLLHVSYQPFPLGRPQGRVFPSPRDRGNPPSLKVESTTKAAKAQSSESLHSVIEPNTIYPKQGPNKLWMTIVQAILGPYSRVGCVWLRVVLGFAISGIQHRTVKLPKYGGMRSQVWALGPSACGGSVVIRPSGEQRLWKATRTVRSTATLQCGPHVLRKTRARPPPSLKSSPNLIRRKHNIFFHGMQHCLAQCTAACYVARCLTMLYKYVSVQTIAKIVL